MKKGFVFFLIASSVACIFFFVTSCSESGRTETSVLTEEQPNYGNIVRLSKGNKYFGEFDDGLENPIVYSLVPVDNTKKFEQLPDSTSAFQLGSDLYFYTKRTLNKVHTSLTKEETMELIKELDPYIMILL